LQNVIERAVIVCDSDTLSIDPRWLAGRSPGTAPVASLSTGTLASHQKDAIEAALQEARARGRALRRRRAARVPASTLESKIKALHIDKRRFKSGSGGIPDREPLHRSFPSRDRHAPRAYRARTGPFRQEGTMTSYEERGGLAVADRDATLVAQLRGRVDGAAEELVGAYGDRVYRLAIRITGSPSDAEEVTQDALWTASRKIDSFRGAAAFGSWL